MKKEYKNYLLLIVIILGMICITTKSNYLFGSYTDWIDQHTVFPDYLRQLFYKTGNLFPSFAMQLGAGQNIYNISYYGLLNPIILFSYLLPHVEMIDYIAISSIITLFISVCLFYKWIRTKQSQPISFLSTLIFSFAAPLIFHAHRHIMFINYMPFLLGALFGVDRYFERKKRGLLSICVFLMILTSYYYSVGGLFVIVCYGIYKYLSMVHKVTIQSFLNQILPFLFTILIGVLLSGILLFPTLYTVLTSRIDIVRDSVMNYLSLSVNVDLFLYSNYSMGLFSVVLFSLVSLFFEKKKERIFLGFIFLSILIFPLITYCLNGGLYVRGKVFIPFLPLVVYAISLFIEKLENRKICLKGFLPCVLFCTFLCSFSYERWKF